MLQQSNTLHWILGVRCCGHWTFKGARLHFTSSWENGLPSRLVRRSFSGGAEAPQSKMPAFAFQASSWHASHCDFDRSVFIPLSRFAGLRRGSLRLQRPNARISIWFSKGWPRCRSPQGEGWCSGRDSNPYALRHIAPSNVCVYQFHHPSDSKQREGALRATSPRPCPARKYSFAE